MAGTIDLLPTSLLSVEPLCCKTKIDGKDIWPLLSGKTDATSPHAVWYYYWQTELHAVQWRLEARVPTQLPNTGRTARQRWIAEPLCPANVWIELYDLKQDIGEQGNVADENAEIVQRLQELANSIRSELGDSLTGVTGHENRQPGSLP